MALTGLLAAALILGWTGTTDAQTLQVGAGVPLVVPFEYSPTIGTGFTPSLQFNLTPHVGLSLTSGMIFYRKMDDSTDIEVPIMLGGRYTFMDPSRKVRPYLTLQLGYSYAHNSTDTNHWPSGLTSMGLLLKAGRDLDIDVEVAARLPNMRSTSEISAQMMLSVGVRYGLI